MNHQSVDTGGERVSEQTEQRGDCLCVCSSALRPNLGRNSFPAEEVCWSRKLAVGIDGFPKSERLELGS